jgi:signal transduction histidine kinase
LGIYGEAGFSIALYAWGTALIIIFFTSLSFRTAIILSLSLYLGVIIFPRASFLWNEWVGERNLGEVVGQAVFYFLTILFVATIRFITEREKKIRKVHTLLQESLMRLTSANVGFQNYAVAAEQRGSDEERLRITREIHDMVGYTLSNFIMMTKASEELIDTDHETLRRLLRDAGDQCQEALSETRRTLRELRSIQEPETEFPNQIWKTVRTFEMATGIRVQLEFRNVLRIASSTIRTVLHRLVQESLTNAFRHGHASAVSILFWDDGEGVSVCVRDNGRGSAMVKEDIGLMGMRERFEPLGGNVKATSMSSEGFEVRAWIPIPISSEVQK